MENAKKYLATIGVENNVIESLFAEEPAEDFDVDKSAKQYLDSIKEVGAENPENISKLKAEAKGEVLSKVEHKISKAFGLTSEEVKEKKFDDILELVKDKQKEAGTATAEEWQEKLLSANNKLKELQETEIPKIQKEAENKIKSFHVQNQVLSSINKIETIIEKDAIFPIVQAHLQNNYDFDVTEEGVLDVKTKQGTAPISNDGTKKIDLQGIINEHLTSLKLIKQSNGSGTSEEGPKGSTPKPVATEKPKFNLPGMKAAQDNLAAMQNGKA